MCAAKNTDKNTDEKRTMGIQLTEDQIQRLKAYCYEEDRSHRMVCSFGGQRVARQERQGAQRESANAPDEARRVKRMSSKSPCSTFSFSAIATWLIAGTQCRLAPQLAHASRPRNRLPWGCPVANDTRDSYGPLRRAEMYSGSDHFMRGHQTMKIATKPRKTPEWTKTDARIRAVLLRSHPKLREDSSVGRTHASAQVCGSLHSALSADERRTLLHIAQDMGMSLEAAKSLTHQDCARRPGRSL